MKIEADIKNLKKILVDDDSFYQIPDYQRPYSWDKDNLADLIDDLVNAYVSSSDENYFCGSLVLVNNTEDHRFDIIDGQQRTTTFTILSCVLRDLFFDKMEAKAKKYINNSIKDEFEDEKRKLKFLTNEKYQIDFEETVLKGIKFETKLNVDKAFNSNKYLQNAHYLKDLLLEKIDENEINVNLFVIWLFEKIVLTVITCPSQDSAIQIFTVLNDRGMPLSSIDILKSSLMQNLGKEDRKAFKATWEEISTTLSFSEFDLESMLNTYLYYKLSTNPKSRLDKELLSIFKLENRTSLEVIKEIKDFSISYVKTLTENCKYLYCCKYLKHKIYWTSILVTADYVKYKDIDKLKEILIGYYYQNWIAGATVARIKQTSFNILKLIKANKPIETIKSEIVGNLNKYNTTKTFKEELTGTNVYGRKWDKAILLLIEYFSTDNSSVSYTPLTSNLHLEHVLPQTPSSSWNEVFEPSDIEIWTNTLANLTLLSMRKNIQAQNFSFSKKKDIYQNRDYVTSSFLITQDILACVKWDCDELETREKRLIEKVYSKLDLFVSLDNLIEIEALTGS